MPSSIPKKRQELLQWNGWGYKDSGFAIVQKGPPSRPKYSFTFTGSRYELANSDLPHFFDWVNMKMGIEPSKKREPQGEPEYPQPVVNDGSQSPAIQCRLVLTLTGSLFHSQAS